MYVGVGGWAVSEVVAVGTDSVMTSRHSNRISEGKITDIGHSRLLAVVVKE